jgi:hypothetical protein
MMRRIALAVRIYGNFPANNGHGVGSESIGSAAYDPVRRPSATPPRPRGARTHRKNCLRRSARSW